MTFVFAFASLLAAGVCVASVCQFLASSTVYGIFLDTVNIITVALGMVIVFTELYPVISLSVSLALATVASTVYTERSSSYPVKIKFCTLVKCMDYTRHLMLFLMQV